MWFLGINQSLPSFQRSQIGNLMHQNTQLKEKLGRICNEASDIPPLPPGMTDSLMRGAVAPGGLPMPAGSLAYNNRVGCPLWTIALKFEQEAWIHMFAISDHVFRLFFRVLGHEWVLGERWRFHVLIWRRYWRPRQGETSISTVIWNKNIKTILFSIWN